MSIRGDSTLSPGTSDIGGADVPSGRRASRVSRASIYRFTAVVLVAAVLLFVLLLRVLAATQTADAGTGGLVGQHAPNFSLAIWNLSPSPLTLHQLQGEPVVVNFWASWCAPCQQEAPLLTAAARASATTGVAILGVAEQTGKSDGSQFIQQHGIPYPCGSDPNGAIATSYAVPGLPVTIFINRQGIVAQRVTGQLSQTALDDGLRAITS